jgi:aryl-alcohol dehydrogenase-like predicted oxidoreductase
MGTENTRDDTTGASLSRRTFLGRVSALAVAPMFLEAGSDFGTSLRRPRRYGKMPFALFPRFVETQTYGAGTFQLGDRRLLIDALEKGVRLVDTSPDYRDGGAEKDVGWALKKAPEPVFVMTQIPEVAWTKGNRRIAFHRALRFSLDRLQRGNVEALLIRNAEPEQIEDPEFRKFAKDVKQNGQVKRIGISGQSSGLEKSLETVLTDELIEVVLFAAHMARFQTIPDLLAELRDNGKILVASLPEEAALWGRQSGWKDEDERRRNEPWNGEWDPGFTRRALRNAIMQTSAHNAVLSIRRPDDVAAVLGQ